MRITIPGLDLQQAIDHFGHAVVRALVPGAWAAAKSVRRSRR